MLKTGTDAGERVRVLIVDDSALIRRLLSQILSSDPGIEVVGVASDPIVAREKIKVRAPDVITLDIEMPRVNGLEFLETLMRLRPLPVVMVSALTQRGADATLRALEIGAVDFIAKPTFDKDKGWAMMRDEVIAKVKAAARASVQGISRTSPIPAGGAGAYSGLRQSGKIVAIGASTGGVKALQEVLSGLPVDGPPILIAQHMPATFTGRFAERLNGICAPSVSEAEHDAWVVPGQVYIAPGDKHLTLARSGDRFRCKLQDGLAVNWHCPSVDVLFKSVAVAAGSNGIGALLTGMGKDGAEGLREMRQAGAVTICQDEATSLIYGMPQAAKAIGAAACELPLGEISAYILNQVRETRTQDRGLEAERPRHNGDMKERSVL